MLYSLLRVGFILATFVFRRLHIVPKREYFEKYLCVVKHRIWKETLSNSNKMFSTSLDTLPVELVYRILDHLDILTILLSCRNVCTKLNNITDTYHRCQVIDSFTLKSHHTYISKCSAKKNNRSKVSENQTPWNMIDPRNPSTSPILFHSHRHLPHLTLLTIESVIERRSILRMSCSKMR